MTNETALVKFERWTLAELKETATLFAASGYFTDAHDMAKAFVKIKTGHELGFSAMVSMTGISIIQGKPVLGANLIAAKVKTSGYDYRIKELTNDKCSIDFFNKDKEFLGNSTFTLEDAKTAGLAGKDNWKKYGRNMLFARAMANGQKWFCPDATSGMTVYSPDELGMDVDEDGNPIDPKPITTKKKEPSLDSIIEVANITPPIRKTEDASFEDILNEGNATEGEQAPPVLVDEKEFLDAVDGKLDTKKASKKQITALYAVNGSTAKLGHESLVALSELAIGHPLPLDPEFKKHLSSMTSSEASMVMGCLENGTYHTAMIKVNHGIRKQIGVALLSLTNNDATIANRLLWNLTGYPKTQDIPDDQLENWLKEATGLTPDSQLVKDTIAESSGELKLT
jgi:hypothetical protein